jgi:hypothetical protein
MASDPAELNHLIPALHALVRVCDREKLPFMVIGGMAAALLGRPRLTADVDATLWIDPEELDSLLHAARREGFAERIPNALPFARKHRVLRLVHQPSAVPADLSLGALPFEESAIRRARRIRVAGVAVPVAAPEDLMVMKAVAQRPRDITDMESLLDCHPKLNLRFVRRVVKEFAETLEAPELTAGLDRLIAQWRSARSRRKKLPKK